MNNLRKFLNLFELISFQSINLEIIKKKYRELAMRYHPDITGRDTNKEMAEINKAYEYLINNLYAANEELKNIWRDKEAEFAHIYRDAIIRNLSSATIAQLRRSIRLFNSISGYKNVEELIKKYTTQLNKLLKEEARKEAIYKEAILDIRKASIKELEKAISLLRRIPNYKDSNNLVLIYQNQINKIKEEIKKNERYYKRLQQIKNDSISDAEFDKIIRFLSSYNTTGSEDLLNHFYHRQNQFASVEKRLENERNEKIYIVLLSEFNKAKTVKDFREIISKYTRIKNYKNVSSILSQCKTSIENIIKREEYDRKDKLYSDAIEYLKQTKDNLMLQKAIDILKTIRNFKEAEELIAKAVSLIFDNNEENRKSKIYNKGVNAFETNDFKHLEDILKELNTVDEYKDIDNLKKKYQSKIDKLKNDLYNQAKIDINNATIDKLEKSISILNKIKDYKNSSKLINLYKKKISSIKKEAEEKKKADREEIYLKGLIGDDEEVTEKLLKKKIKILLSIQSYKESRKIIQSYKKYLRELQNERRKKQFKKYSLTFVKFYLPILILLLIGTLVTTKVVVPAAQYNQGINLLESGNYQEAIDKFNKVKDKNNVSRFIIAAEAGLLLDTGDYSTAITKLESIDAEINIGYDQSTTQLLSMTSIKSDPIEDGYSFVRWDLNDYSIKAKKDDVTADLYLKAVWRKNNYKVKFNTNGGEILPNISFDIEEDDIILPDPIKKGYTFLGWYNNSNFSGSEINKIKKGTYENVTLYAKWEANSYNLILDYNYDDVKPDISKINFDDKYGELPKPRREGYLFMGWYDGDFNISSSDIFKVEGNITLIAKWSKIKYKIEFDRKDEVHVENISFYIDSNPINLPEINREGYEFNGWYSNEQYYGEPLVSIPTNTSENIYLHAKWVPIISTVTIDYNDGIRENIDFQVDFDSAYTFLKGITREHYNLTSWTDVGGNVYTDKSIHKATSNFKLIANWELKPYYLIVNINNFETIQKKIYFEQQYFDILSEITLEGYDFINAYYNNGDLLLEDDQFINSSLTDVYLEFEPKEFDLKIVYGEKEEDFEIHKIKTDEKYSMLEGSYYKDGYINKGFYEGSSRFYSYDIYVQNKNQTLKIKWELNESQFKLTLKGKPTVYHQIRTVYTDPGVEYSFGYETNNVAEKIYDNVDYNIQGTYYVKYVLKDVDDNIVREVQRTVVVKNIEPLKLVSSHSESKSYMRLDLNFNKTIVRYSINNGITWTSNYSTNISRSFPNNTNTQLNIIVEDNEGLRISNIKVKILNVKPSVSGRYYVDDYYFWPLEMWVTEYVLEFTITGSNYTYQIYRGGSSVKSGSGSGTRSFTERFDRAGSYSITVTDEMGNTASYNFR